MTPALTPASTPPDSASPPPKAPRCNTGTSPPKDLTPAAIDDVISRGGWQDWVELRLAALSDSAKLDKIARVCQAHICDACAQRYHFWNYDAKAHSKAA